MTRVAFPQGLKPNRMVANLMARLKPCPFNATTDSDLFKATVRPLPFKAKVKPRPFKAVAIGFMLLGCAAALATCVASAQTGAGAYRIAGTVVNATTGAPVAGATVAVLTVEDSQRVAAVQSDGDGRFAIGGLPAAKYELTASKRGYATAAYEEHDEFSSAVVTGAGQETGNLVFRLTPSAVLRGVVTSDGGDPVEGARVMLFKKPASHEPGAKIEQADTAITDDTGTYEFDNLAKGEYLAAVAAEPWYALHHSSSRQGAVNPALDVAYPVTYYDSTAEEAAATPITLAGGSRVEADISIHAVPALRLAVEAPRKQDGSIVRPELRQVLFGTEVSAESVGFYDAIQTGNTEFTGVAPGQYELTQGDPPRVAVLDANSSQQIEPGAGIPAFPVSGRLQSANGEPLTDNAVLTLEPADNAQGLKPVQSDFNHGNFSFALVPAGTWRLRVEQSGLAVPVISVGAGGHEHQGNVITVRDRPLTIVAKVSAGGVKVEGFAKRDAKGVAGAMVLLVPKDPGAFPDLVRRDQSDSDGSFAIRDAAPGEYTVVAIEGAWGDSTRPGGNGLDWTLPEVIGRYLPGGVAVTVTDTTEKVVRLPGPVPVQMR